MSTTDSKISDEIEQTLEIKRASEIKQTLDRPETERGVSKPRIFVSTAQRDVRYDTPGTGDIDYARAIVDQVNLLEPDSAELIKGLYEEEEVYKQVLKQSDSPTLHIMLNPPFTGMAFTPKGIEGFRRRGGRVVITAIEFAKFEGREEEYRKKCDGIVPQQVILQFLAYADGAVFLDENDKKTAIEFFRRSKSDKTRLEYVLKNASIIPVLPTILPLTKPLVERGKHIISFGIIRQGKSLGLVIELARKIKTDKINKTVLVVGTVLENEDGLFQLQRLMVAGYPTKRSEIEKITSVSGLKAKLQEYQKTLASDLPLEIYTDVPKAELPALFNRCSYAFLPAYRGATLRNSSISSCIAQQFIVYTHDEGITPSVLLPSGTYHGAVIIKEFQAGSRRNESAGRQYVLSVLQDILARDTDPELNAPNLKAIEGLLTQVLSPKAIARQHLERYSSLEQPSFAVSSSDESIGSMMPSQPIGKFPYYVHHFRALIQAKRAYKQFGKTHGFDVEKQAEANFSALKKVWKTLKPEEIEFCGSLLDGDWYLTHATSAYPEIQKKGNALRSLRERIRQSMEIESRHTNYGEGNDDNVFFAFGPGKISSPEFLSKAGHVIEVDFNRGLQKKQQKKTHGLTGMWTSGHAYAFLTEQHCSPIIIHGTKVSVSYEKIDPKGPKTTKNLHKIYRFEYQNPSSRTGELIQSEEIVRLQDEIFFVQHMKAALVLMTIGKIRQLGPVAWQAIMRDKSLESRQQIVQDIFHVGIFEAHKPGFLSLDEDYITVKEMPRTTALSLPKSGGWSEALNVIKAILEGNTDLARRLIQGDTTLLLSSAAIQGEINESINPFDLAVIMKNTELLKWFLDSDNPLLSEKQSNYSLSSRKMGGKWIYDTLITAVLLLASPNIKQLTGCHKAEQDIKFFREYLALVMQHSFSVVGRSHLRRPYSIRDVDISNAINFGLPISEICFLVGLSRDIHPKQLPFSLAVTTGSCELVELMLKRGAGVNQDLTYGEHSNEQVKGSTPLLQAILGKNESIIDLLLAQEGIDVNRRWEAFGKFSGYTPLMLAAELGLEEVVNKLLAKGARVDCLNTKGETALEIASTKGFSGIVKMLLQAMPDSRALSVWEKLALAKPHHIRGGVVLLARDADDKIKILVVGKQFFQEDVIKYFPFEPSILEGINEYSQIKVVSKGKLLEYGFQLDSSNTYYGYQLQFIELSTESLSFIETEMSDQISVKDLQALQVKASEPRQFSALEKAIVTHLKKEEGGKFYIREDGQKQVAEALKAYLSSVVSFRQAIDTRDLKGVQEFLATYPGIDLEEFTLPGEYPATARIEGEVDPIAIVLTNSLGFTEATLVFFKSGSVKPSEHNFYDLFQAIVREDDLETFLEVIGESSRVEIVSSSITPGCGKRYFESLSVWNFTDWFGKQSVLTGKIAGWLLQYKKEMFDLDNIISSSIRSLSVQCVEHWMSQGQKFSSSYYLYSLADALDSDLIKGRVLTSQEQDSFLQILAKLLNDGAVNSLPYWIEKIIKSLSNQEKFLDKVLLLLVKNLKPEKCKELIKDLLYKDLKDFNAKNKTVFYDLLTKLLATIEMGNPNWISMAITRKDVELFTRVLEKSDFTVDDTWIMCHQLNDVLKDDRLILQGMLETLVTLFALNPENRIVNTIVKYLEENPSFFSKELMVLFNKLMAEKDQLKEQALKAKEQKEAKEQAEMEQVEAPSLEGQPEVLLDTLGSTTIPVSGSPKVGAQTLCNHLLDLSRKIETKGDFDDLIAAILQIVESRPSFDDASIQTIAALLTGLPNNMEGIDVVIQKIEAVISQPTSKEQSLRSHGQMSSSTTSSSGVSSELGDRKQRVEDWEVGSGLVSTLTFSPTLFGNCGKEKEKTPKDGRTPLLFSFGQTAAQHFTNLSTASSSSLSSLSSSTSFSSSSLPSASTASKTTFTPLQSHLSSTTSSTSILSSVLQEEPVRSGGRVVHTQALFKAIEASDVVTVKANIKKLKLLDQNIQKPGSKETLYEILLKPTVTEEMRETVRQTIIENLKQESIQQLEEREGGQKFDDLPAWEENDLEQENDEVGDEHDEIWNEEDRQKRPSENMKDLH